jgi:energy-coupling factor transport system substrate-specific component
MRRFGCLNLVILLAASAAGVMAFLYPFFSLSADQQAGGMAASAHAQDAPFVLLMLVTLCLGAILANLQSGQMNSKMVAVLGVLVAMNAVLRAVPGPAGFSLVFILPILCGYAFGGTFGFLLGALSLLVSAFLGGGVGPWLPYQMFTTGWVGLLSSWLPNMRRLGRGEGLILAGWGFLLGLVFGAIMNIWFWPFVMGPVGSDMYWSAGSGMLETLKRYLVFYGVTSLWWDLARAVGNLLLIALFGRPILKVLRRFQLRFNFLALPGQATAGESAGAAPAVVK